MRSVLPVHSSNPLSTLKLNNTHAEDTRKAIGSIQVGNGAMYRHMTYIASSLAVMVACIAFGQDIATPEISVAVMLIATSLLVINSFSFAKIMGQQAKDIEVANNSLKKAQNEILQYVQRAETALSSQQAEQEKLQRSQQMSEINLLSSVASAFHDGDTTHLKERMQPLYAALNKQASSADNSQKLTIDTDRATLNSLLTLIEEVQILKSAEGVQGFMQTRNSEKEMIAALKEFITLQQQTHHQQLDTLREKHDEALNVSKDVALHWMDRAKSAVPHLTLEQMIKEMTQG